MKTIKLKEAIKKVNEINNCFNELSVNTQYMVVLREVGASPRKFILTEESDLQDVIDYYTSRVYELLVSNDFILVEGKESSVNNFNTYNYNYFTLRIKVYDTLIFELTIEEVE